MDITRRSLLLSAAGVAMLGIVSDVNQRATAECAVDAVGRIPYPAVAAHRGGAEIHAENTLAAFREASELGPQMVLEMDVRSLRDGTLVLSHDASVDRTSANVMRGKTREMTGAKWSRVRIKHPAGGAPAQATFLREVLEEYGGTDRVLMIELKDHGILDEFVDALWPYRDQVIACSFDADNARAFTGSGLHSQLLGTPQPGAIPQGLHSVGVKDVEITKAICREAHDKGTKVWAWGEHLRNNDHALLAMGVDGFIVNNPTI